MTEMVKMINRIKKIYLLGKDCYIPEQRPHSCKEMWCTGNEELNRSEESINSSFHQVGTDCYTSIFYFLSCKFTPELYLLGGTVL